MIHAITAQLDETQPRVCCNREVVQSWIPHCSICGIFVPKDKTFTFLRPKFSSSNPFVGDPILILNNMISKQHTNRYYNHSFSLVEQRLAVIEWAEEFTARLWFKPSTFYTAVTMIDAMFSFAFLEGYMLHLLAIVCVILAAKMKERDEKLPKLSSMLEFFQNKFTAEEYNNLEEAVCSIMRFSLNVQTPFCFSSYLVFRGAISSDEISLGLSNKILEDFDELFDVMNRLSVDCYDLNQFPALTVGASAVALARKYTGLKVYWPEHLSFVTGLNWESIRVCFEMLESYVKEFLGSELQIKNVLECPFDYELTFRKAFGDDSPNAPTQNSSIRTSIVISEFECFDEDDDNVFGEPHLVVLRPNV